MSIVAEERAAHPELRQLSQDIIAAQQPEIIQMTAWRDAWFPDVADISNAQALAAFDQMTNPMPGMGGIPGSSEMMMGDMHDIDTLCEADAEHFDLQFIDEMVARCSWRGPHSMMRSTTRSQRSQPRSSRRNNSRSTPWSPGDRS